MEKIKDMARGAKIYREETYSPIVAKALEFILAFQTDKLVTGADVRYGKIETDIKKLEKADFIRTGFFSREMGESKKLISDARGLVEKAKSEVISPDEGAKEDASDEKATDAGKEVAPTPRELCEAALVNLKSSYGIFVEISASVKKILKL